MKFQSPSLRGSGRFRLVWGYPFELNLMFQSPSLRGSGRFPERMGADMEERLMFQSPSLRGSGRFVRAARPTSEEARKGFNPLHCGAVVASRCGHCRRSHCCFVSIPFIAGQWSLPSPETSWIYFLEVFQSPSLRGSGRFLATLQIPGVRCCRFQSPSLRGSGRFLYLGLGTGYIQLRFNPLHCGAVVASFPLWSLL